jgi:hydroxyacylglutathione hydrolase
MLCLAADHSQERDVHLETFHLPSLGHASYLVASDRTGDALVLDPRRDVQPYLDAAARLGYRIRWVVDSHQHNDYLSGLRELVERTGATALGSAYGDLGYRHEPVKDGQTFEIGEVGVEVLHTPGHTPEHVSLLLTDGDLDPDEPAILLSGGALLVGDLARPDLLGGDADTQEAARAFCRTIQERILPLPDHVLVHPTHVAGSLCGGAIGSRLVTTVGYERRTNSVLTRVTDADGFVSECMDLDDLPAVPPYWPRMRTRNAAGVEPVGVVDLPPALDLDGFRKRRDEDGVVVLDVRSVEAFAGGHVPGALSVPAGSSFPTWAGTVLPEDARTVLVTDEGTDIGEVTWELLRIGYPVPLGHLAGGMLTWRSAGEPVATLATATVHDVADRLDDLHVLDVRQPSEWADGVAPGAHLLTGAQVPARADEVPTDRDVLVVCGSGHRSTVVAAYLQAHGHPRVLDLWGGMAAWQAADLPVTER